MTFLRKSVGLAAMLTIILALAVSLLPQSSATTFAQEDDALTPNEYCAEAEPNISEPETRSYSEPEQVLEDGVDYAAIFCTEDGAVYVDLLEDFTPVTVNNFVFLSQNDYYNNTTFHRVIPDFMAQGGDPTATGTGGPGYQFEDEFKPFLTFNTPGWLAMANAGPGTNGSQFFLTRTPTPHLNNRHTIFGEIVAGQDVVDNMRDRDPQADAGTPGVGLLTVLILTDEDAVDVEIEPVEVTSIEDISALIASIPLEQEGFAVIENESGVITRSFDDFGDISEGGVSWQLEECPADPNISSVAYRVQDWEDSEIATEAYSDEDFLNNVLAEGFDDAELQEDGGYIASVPKTECDAAGTEYRRVWQRGRYIMTFDVFLPEGLVPAENIPVAMVQLSNNFEVSIADAVYNALK